MMYDELICRFDRAGVESPASDKAYFAKCIPETVKCG